MERYWPEPDSVKRKRTDLDPYLDSVVENLLLPENCPIPDSKILHQNDPDTDSDSDAKDSDGTILDILRYLRDYQEVSDPPGDYKVKDPREFGVCLGLLNFKCTFQNWIALF
jgi:hypothetical protein